MTRMSLKKVRQLAERGMVDPKELEGLSESRFSNAEKVVAPDGTKLDSKAEARKYVHLLFLQRASRICDLRVHPTYVLRDRYVDSYGRVHRAITYEGDFSYVESDTGQAVVCEVKGRMTAAAAIKLKLFQERYPEIRLDVEYTKDTGQRSWR